MKRNGAFGFEGDVRIVFEAKKGKQGIQVEADGSTIDIAKALQQGTVAILRKIHKKGVNDLQGAAMEYSAALVMLAGMMAHGGVTEIDLTELARQMGGGGHEN